MWPPRPPSRPPGVMTKRYFFPVHRMDVYQKFARRCCRSPTGSMSDYFASRSTPICPMSASTPLHNSSAPAQFVRPRSRRRLESCDGPDPKMRLCGSTLESVSSLMVAAIPRPGRRAPSTPPGRPAAPNANPSVGPSPSPPASDPTAGPIGPRGPPLAAGSPPPRSPPPRTGSSPSAAG